MTAPIVFLDTETTGLHPVDRRPWEIAMIRRDETGDEVYHLLQIADVDLTHADEKALQIGRFHDRHVTYAGHPPAGLVRSEASAAAYVERVTRGVHIVGANPAFDAATLDPMLRRHGLIPSWHYHLIDVEALALGYIHAKDPGASIARPPYFGRELVAAVEELSGISGIAPAEADLHTAMGDARWVQRLYDAIAGGRP